MPSLNPNGSPIRVGRATLRTPGLSGEARAHTPGSTDMRSAEMTMASLDRALDAHSALAQETIEIKDTTEHHDPAIEMRSSGSAEPEIELQYPAPNEDYAQVVMAVDEAGVITWNFPVAKEAGAEAARGEAMNTYRIRRTTPPAAERPEAAESRGVVGAIGKKLLKVLVLPIIDPIIGAVAERYAAHWEARNRPYALRSFRPESFSQSVAGGADVSELTKGRALLMIHGTFSRTHSAFGELPAAFVQTLHDIYGGRVFAFDHPTMSEDPTKNVEWFTAHLAAQQPIEVDVVCHSRGGLVTRVLAEHPTAAPMINVRRAVFVAVPNAGTLLADDRHMGDFIDAYTNVLNFFPDNGVTETLEAVIAVVKQLAVGSLKGLEGLQSMNPKGAYLGRLNAAVTSKRDYFALASDYEPRDAGLKMFVANRLIDRVFNRKGNDLVVPTEGVYADNGATPLFPIKTHHAFTQADGVMHTRFFGMAVTQEKILEWLR
jgi:pimeloyl-ACP methyl ester carboxylesterase